jgi:hypothetical protein
LAAERSVWVAGLVVGESWSGERWSGRCRSWLTGLIAVGRLHGSTTASLTCSTEPTGPPTPAASQHETKPLTLQTPPTILISPHPLNGGGGDIDFRGTFHPRSVSRAGHGKSPTKFFRGRLYPAVSWSSFQCVPQSHRPRGATQSFLRAATRSCFLCSFGVSQPISPYNSGDGECVTQARWLFFCSRPLEA